MDNSNEYIKERAKDPKLNSTDPKTSSSDGSSSEETNTGESSVQNGEQVVNEEDQNKAINTEQTNEEYISDINTNTKEANTNPKGLTNLLATPGGEDEEEEEEEEEDDDDDDDDDDGDDPLKELEIGDDPDDTKKKIPVM